MPLDPTDIARWRVLAQKTRGWGDDEDEAYRAVGLLLAEVERLTAPAGTERMSLVGDDGEVASALRAKRPEDERLRAENDRLRTEWERFLHDPVRRWNVHRAEGADLIVCRGEHERSEACEEERFVPAATAARLRSLLREVEWGGCSFYFDWGACHFCRGLRPWQPGYSRSIEEIAAMACKDQVTVGHASGCRLAAELKP